MTHVTLVGTYRVVISAEELEFMAKSVHGIENARAEVARTVLVEIEVHGAESDFDIGQFELPWDQVAYDEVYFALDGTKFNTSGFDRPDAADFRVCFYLHDFDAGDTIITPYGNLKTGALTDIPERLAKHCVYQHPG